MNKTEKKVKELISTYGTAEPLELCEEMGIITVDHELPSCVNGFTVRVRDIPFIVLNSELNYYERRVTMAHELGHIVLHKGTNSVELSCNTSFCVSKYEREADCFAVCLLMQAELSSFEGHECVTAEEVSQMTHIPMSMVEKALSQEWTHYGQRHKK